MKPKLKQKITEIRSPKATEPSDFAFKLTKIAVSQICQTVGFKSARLSALETLTHIATLYLKTLAKISASYSNASNRTQCNALDLINALYDLSSVQGFVGASSLHSTNCSSIAVKDLFIFMNAINEIPFAKPIPRANSSPSLPRSDPLDLGFRGTHIPQWLPRFPDERTYEKSDKMERHDKKKRDWDFWENNCSGIENENESNLAENKEKKNSDDKNLAMERFRVRFKIGEVKNGEMDIRVYKRNWASKRGKRVCCD